MSIYSNVTEEGLINLRKLAEQQKEQRALKIKGKISKQTHNIKLAESLSPKTKKLGTINESSKQFGELVKKSKLDGGHSQTAAIKNTPTSHSLRDTLSFMKNSKNFFKLQQDDDGLVFWNETPVNTLEDNRISMKNQEDDIKPNFQKYFTNTNLTTKNMDDEDKLTVYDILKNSKIQVFIL